MKYEIIQHVDSNNSYRRGLLFKMNPLTGQRERVRHTTTQVLRSGPDGVSLPHVAHVDRSKYSPHVGKKQLAKAAVRNHVAA